MIVLELYFTRSRLKNEDCYQSFSSIAFWFRNSYAKMIGVGKCLFRISLLLDLTFSTIVFLNDRWIYQTLISTNEVERYS
jgi:hypothetical protein